MIDFDDDLIKFVIQFGCDLSCPFSSSSLSFPFDHLDGFVSIFFMMCGLVLDELSSFQIYLLSDYESFKVL